MPPTDSMDSLAPAISILKNTLLVKKSPEIQSSGLRQKVHNAAARLPFLPHCLVAPHSSFWNSKPFPDLAGPFCTSQNVSLSFRRNPSTPENEGPLYLFRVNRTQFRRHSLLLLNLCLAEMRDFERDFSGLAKEFSQQRSLPPSQGPEYDHWNPYGEGQN